jgi:uric acid transporter
MSSHETLTRPDSAAPSTGPHPVDAVPPLHKLLVFGLQHLAIMYAGAVAVPLIVGPAVGLNSSQIAALVSADLLVSGIATIIHSPRASRTSSASGCRWSRARPSRS